MKKPLLVIVFLLIPALLIFSGFYFKKDILSSVGYVILIFYVVMAIRGRFSSGDKEKNNV